MRGCTTAALGYALHAGGFFIVGATCPSVGVRRGLGFAVVFLFFYLGALVGLADLDGAVRAAMLCLFTFGNWRKYMPFVNRSFATVCGGFVLVSSMIA